jgi:hypothetical protein
MFARPEPTFAQLILPDERDAYHSTVVEGFVRISPWVNWQAIKGQPPLLVEKVNELFTKILAGDDEAAISASYVAAEQSSSPERLGLSAWRAANHALWKLKLAHAGTQKSSDHVPNPGSDIPEYISRWSDDYTSYIRQLAQQLPPMDPRCETVIAIPVAAHEEGQHLTDTLRAFGDQTERAERFEIVLFLNYPAKCSVDQRERVENLDRMIDEYRADHPQQRIVCMRGALDTPQVTKMGFIRSFVADAILLRSLDRECVRDFILWPCDADTRAVTKRYVENQRLRFGQSPNTDAFVGTLRWSPERCLENPLVFVNHRLTELIWQLARLEAGSGLPGGPVHAIRATVFALVGGYREDDKTAEDLYLESAVKKFRKGALQFLALEDAGPLSRLYSSTRRGEVALHSRQPCMNQWLDTTMCFGTNNSDVRANSPGAALAPEIKDNRQLLGAIESVINLTFDSFWFHSIRVGHDFEARVSKIGIEQHLGIDIVKGDSRKVYVTSIDRFLRYFEEYQANGKSRWRGTLSR